MLSIETDSEHRKLWGLAERKDNSGYIKKKNQSIIEEFFVSVTE